MDRRILRDRCDKLDRIDTDRRCRLMSSYMDRTQDIQVSPKLDNPRAF